MTGEFIFRTKQISGKDPAGNWLSPIETWCRLKENYFTSCLAMTPIKFQVQPNYDVIHSRLRCLVISTSSIGSIIPIFVDLRTVVRRLEVICLNEDLWNATLSILVHPVNTAFINGVLWIINTSYSQKQVIYIDYHCNRSSRHTKSLEAKSPKHRLTQHDEHICHSFMSTLLLIVSNSTCYMYMIHECLTGHIHS